MQSQVIFRDRQELQAKDFTNIQVFASDAIKAVVNDGITDERRFTGFAVTAAGATDLVVEPGRLYHQGTLYGRSSQTELSLFQYLPVATKRVLALVAWGQNAEAATEPRDFLVDLTTGATEPQAVPMESRNQVEINLVAGVESADPVAPAVPDNTVIVAFVVLNTTGVEEIQFQTGNQLPNAKDNQRHIRDMQAWRNQVGPQIGAIQTSFTALEQKTEGKADRSALVKMAADVATLKERSGLPDNYSAYGADRFADTDESDTTAPGYDARIDKGVVFPYAGHTEAPLALFNPYDDRVKRSAGGFVLPKYAEEAKVQVTGYNGDASLSQYQVQTHTVEQYTQYVYGWHYGYYGYSYYWNHYYGYYYHPYYGYSYYPYYYYQYPVTSYRTVTTTTNYNGVIVGQTFLTPAAFWMTSVDLYLTQIGSAGDITVAICECDYGKPNLRKAVSTTTLARADMVRYPAASRVPVPPVWLEAGKRYAIMLITEGSHRTAMVGGNSYTQGTWFYGSDGDYFTGDITKNLMFSINGAAFEQPRTEIVLGEVSLAGGITDIGVQTEAIVPDGTSLTYEVQVNGRWMPLEAAGLITARPDIAPLRAIVVGTRDAAPGFQLGAARLIASRPKTTMQHISTLRTLPGSTTSGDITLTFLVSGFDQEQHTFTARLIDENGEQIALADTTTFDVEHADSQETVTRITCAFALDTPVNKYKVEFTGTRTVSVAPFRVLERMDVAI